MKTLLLLLCSTLACAAQMRGPAWLASMTAPVASAPANTNFFFEETFEGTGYVNTWSTGGDTPAPDPDYTTNVLAGSQSLLIGNAATFHYTASEFSAKTEVYGKFRVFKLESGGTTSSSGKLTLSRIGVADDMVIAFNSGGDVAMKHGTTEHSAAIGMGEGTNYFVWFQWTVGTGANGVGKCWVASSDSKPGSPQIDFSDGNGTSNPSAVSCQSPGVGIVFDSIQLSTNSIQ